MAPHERLGVTIREARLEKSMSLGQLASAVGRSSSSVRRWERGEVAPAASVLPKLSAILEIDIQDLRPGEKHSETGSDDQRSEGEGGSGRGSTVEQPVISADEPADAAPQLAPKATAPPRSGVLSRLWGSATRGGQGWLGWIRGFLTAAALVVMLFILVWAMGELFDALWSVLDSFDAGTNGG
jgi:transcriptional regulator with XRE-family HTH domain